MPVTTASLGLALGGGAARGLAHIGVLRELEERGVRPDVITGTSMGALVGALYASLGDAAVLEERVVAFLKSDKFVRDKFDFLNEARDREKSGLLSSLASLVKKGIVLGSSLTRASFLSAEHFADNVESILPEADIEDLPVPFAAAALDLVSGQEVVISRGSVREAVRASSAIPGILPPVVKGDQLLSDGGWVNKVPVIHCFDLGADVVVGVDVSVRMQETRDLRRGIDVMTRANACTEWALRQMQLGLCDLVIRPRVGGVHWANFDAAPRLIERGRKAIARSWSELDELLRAERRWGWLRPSRGVRRARHFRQEPGQPYPRTGW